jgi:hypothetical protein
MEHITPGDGKRRSNQGSRRRSSGDSSNASSVPCKVLDGLNRYDPKSMNRISGLVDISDRSSEGEESDDADNDNIIIPDKVKDNSLLAPTKPSKNDKTTRRLPDGRTIGRLILQVASVAIILFCIGSVIVYNNNSENHNAPSTPQLQLSNEQTSEQLRLLEIAEEVVLQCSEEMFDTSGMEACQRLCHDRLCCFDEGDYSCEDDEDVNCPVYAGCGALLGFE